MLFRSSTVMAPGTMEATNGTIVKTVDLSTQRSLLTNDEPPKKARGRPKTSSLYAASEPPRMKVPKGVNQTRKSKGRILKSTTTDPTDRVDLTPTGKRTLNKQGSKRRAKIAGRPCKWQNCGTCLACKRTEDCGKCHPCSAGQLCLRRVCCIPRFLAPANRKPKDTDERNIEVQGVQSDNFVAVTRDMLDDVQSVSSQSLGDISDLNASDTISTVVASPMPTLASTVFATKTLLTENIDLSLSAVGSVNTAVKGISVDENEYLNELKTMKRKSNQMDVAASAIDAEVSVDHDICVVEENLNPMLIVAGIVTLSAAELARNVRQKQQLAMDDDESSPNVSDEEDMMPPLPT